MVFTTFLLADERSVSLAASNESYSAVSVFDLAVRFSKESLRLIKSRLNAYAESVYFFSELDSLLNACACEGKTLAPLLAST